MPFLVVIATDGSTAFSGSALQVTAETLEAALSPAKENAPAAAAPPAKAEPAMPRQFVMDDDF